MTSTSPKALGCLSLIISLSVATVSYLLILTENICVGGLPLRMQFKVTVFSVPYIGNPIQIFEPLRRSTVLNCSLFLNSLDFDRTFWLCCRKKFSGNTLRVNLTVDKEKHKRENNCPSDPFLFK